MTTTTSFFNKGLLFTAYKNALKSIKGLTIFYSILSVVSFPMMYFMQVSSDRTIAQIQGNPSVQYKFIGWARIYPTTTVLTYFVLLIAMTILSGALVNRFMHSKNAVDVYHSLPITRIQLLLANFFAAATAVLVPMVVCFGIVTLGNLSVRTATTTDILLTVVKLVILVLVILAITFLCCVCCCAVFDSVAFSVALGVIIPCFLLLLNGTFATMLVGFSGNELDTNALIYSPFACVMSLTIPKGSSVISMRNSIFENPMLYLGYAIAAILILTFACYIYKKRKSELAQSFNTNGFIYQAVIVAASFGLGVTLSIFTQILMFGIDNRLTMILLSAIYGAICYIVFNSILSHSFMQTKKSLLTMSACSILPAIFLTSLLYTGGLGFTDYIPAVQDIEKVSVNYLGTYDSIAYAQTENTTNRGHENTQIYSEDGITAVTQLQKSLINELKDEFFDRQNHDFTTVYRGLKLDYTLKSGRVVKRHYYGNVHLDTALQIDNLEKAPEFKEQHSPFKIANAEEVKTFEIIDGYGENFQTLNLTKEQKEKLYIAMQLDDKNLSYTEKIEQKGEKFCKISVLYNSIETPHGTMPKIKNVAMEITKNQKNTIKALEEIGLVKYAAPQVAEGKKAIVLHLRNVNSPRANVSYASLYGFDSRQSKDILSDVRNRNQEGLPKNIYETEDLETILPQLQSHFYLGYYKTPTFLVLLVDKEVDIKSADIEDIYQSAQFLTYENAPKEVTDYFAADMEQALAENKAN